MINTFSCEFQDMRLAHKIEHHVEPKAYKSHSHAFYELFFFVNGDVNFIVENELYKLKKHSGMLVKPMQYHNVEVLGNEPYDRYVIRFDANVLSENLQNQLSSIAPFFTISDESLLSLFEKLDYYSSKHTGDNLHDIFLSTITELLLELASSFDYAQTEIVNKKMTEILNYINNNLQEKITLESLCKQFYQSKTWLYHAFMESVSVSPIKYIETKRLALANELISAGNQPTKIYATCGYSDYSAFYRAYVTFYKHPPTTVKPKKTAKKPKKPRKTSMSEEIIE